MPDILKLICGAIILIFNLCAFAVMGLDKKRARKNAWRIRERTLWLWAIPFSALGGWLGMQTFRHKTKHSSFKIGMPLLAAAQIALLIFLIVKFLF